MSDIKFVRIHECEERKKLARHPHIHKLPQFFSKIRPQDKYSLQKSFSFNFIISIILEWLL